MSKDTTPDFRLSKHRIRNRKKKEKFDGVDPALKPRHTPYRRVTADDLHKLAEEEDYNVESSERL